MKMLNSKSIALIIPDFDFGGEEKRVVFFANNYLNYFKKVYLFAPNGKSIENLDERVEHIKLSVRDYRSFFSILKEIKNKKIDFLQGHKRATLPILLMSEKFYGVKSNFNYDNIYLDGNLSKYLMPKTVIYLSEVLKDHYQNTLKSHKNLVINMGGDFLEKSSENEVMTFKKLLNLDDHFILLSLGRLSAQKNHKKLLEALHLIKDRKYAVLIVGEGPLEVELRNQTESLGLDKKIHFLGHRTDISLILSVSDALVQSSIFEGFPNVFIEASSIGLPIIATNVGSSKTLVEHTGILVEPNDTKALSAAICNMMDNYDSFKAKAEELKKSAFLGTFNKDEMLKGYLNFYSSETDD